MSDSDREKILLDIARGAIARELHIDFHADKSPAWLHEPAACFVTLMLGGELRGCIGSLEVRRSLLDDIEANARAAAFSDPRFPALSAEEFALIRIEISLLSPLQALQFTDEANALAQLRPGVDGVVFQFRHYRSTFLPQVWNQLPSPQEFIEHLKMKAGLPENFWSNDLHLFRYTVKKFSE